MAERNKKNRMSNRDELAIVTHNNGAQTYEIRARVMTAKMGRKPGLLDLLKDTHTNKKTREIKDRKVLSVLLSVRDKTEEINISAHSNQCRRVAGAISVRD